MASPNPSRSGLYARETFLRLFGTVLLVLSIVGFLSTIWQAVDILLANPHTSDIYARDGFSISASLMIIAWPLYLIVTRLLLQDWEKHVAFRENGVRKWLLYFTLFAGSLTVIIDSILTLRAFLEGDFTSRFLIKSGSVLLVAGLLVAYHAWELGREKWAYTWVPKAASILGSVGILSALVCGFVVGGGPLTRRAEKLDQERLNDLQSLASDLQYSDRKILPATLEDAVMRSPWLNDSVRDPETGLPYEYRIIDQTHFELCATFTTSNTDERTNPYPDHWYHEAGRTCFVRTLEITGGELKPVPAPVL